MSVDNIARKLCRVCLRRNTTYEVDQNSKKDGNGRSERELFVGEVFGTEPLSSILGDVHVVPGNYELHPFSSPLEWYCPQFYINVINRCKILVHTTLESYTLLDHLVKNYYNRAFEGR